MGVATGASARCGPWVPEHLRRTLWPQVCMEVLEDPLQGLPCWRIVGIVEVFREDGVSKPMVSSSIPGAGVHFDGLQCITKGLFQG